MRDYTSIHRPRRLAEVVGQLHVKRAASNLLREFAANSFFPRILVIVGPYGTGKTTVGRILSSYINCEQGPLKACLECESCKAVAGGYHPDVWEVDAASNSSVNDIPQFKEWISYKVRCRRKILILDEAHQLSPKAWDSMLKVAEDGTQQATIVVCTTEYEKLPETIQSRSTIILKLLKHNPQDLKALAEKVCRVENIQIDSDETLMQLVRNADGHARDIVRNLQAAQLYSRQVGLIDAEAVESMLGLTETAKARRFIQAALQKDKPGMLSVLDETYLIGDDFCNTVLELLRHELFLRSVLSKNPQFEGATGDALRLLGMVEDTRHRLRFGDSLATILVAYERWLLGEEFVNIVEA